MAGPGDPLGLFAPPASTQERPRVPGAYDYDNDPLIQAALAYEGDDPLLQEPREEEERPEPDRGYDSSVNPLAQAAFDSRASLHEPVAREPLIPPHQSLANTDIAQPKRYGTIMNAGRGLADRAGTLLWQMTGGAANTIGDLLPDWLNAGIVWDEKGLRVAKGEEYDQHSIVARLDKAMREPGHQLVAHDAVSTDGIKAAWSAGDSAGVAKSVAGFAVQQGIWSVPDMAAMLLAGPSYLLGLSTEYTRERAENNNRTKPTLGDAAAGTATAAVVAALEKFGAERVLGSVLRGEKTSLRRYLEGAIAEAGTEAVQSPAEFAGVRVGTQKQDEITTGNLAEQAGFGALGGLGGGVIIGGVAHGTQALSDRFSRTAPPAAAAPSSSDSSMPSPDEPPAAAPLATNPVREALASSLGRSVREQAAASGTPMDVAILARLDKLIDAAMGGFGDASLAADAAGKRVRQEVQSAPLSVLVSSPRFLELIQAAATLPQEKRIAYARATLANELAGAAQSAIAATGLVTEAPVRRAPAARAAPSVQAQRHNTAQSPSEPSVPAVAANDEGVARLAQHALSRGVPLGRVRPLVTAAAKGLVDHATAIARLTEALKTPSQQMPAATAPSAAAPVAQSAADAEPADSSSHAPSVATADSSSLARGTDDAGERNAPRSAESAPAAITQNTSAGAGSSSATPAHTAMSSHEPPRTAGVPEPTSAPAGAGVPAPQAALAEANTSAGVTRPPAPTASKSSIARQAEGMTAKPRLAENADDLYTQIVTKTESGVPTPDRGVLYPVVDVPGLGRFRVQRSGIDRVRDDGVTTKKATAAEESAVRDAIAKDQADVVVMARWGGSGGARATASKPYQTLHSAAGNAFAKAPAATEGRTGVSSRAEPPPPGGQVAEPGADVTPAEPDEKTRNHQRLDAARERLKATRERLRRKRAARAAPSTQAPQTERPQGTSTETSTTVAEQRGPTGTVQRDAGRGPAEQEGGEPAMRDASTTPADADAVRSRRKANRSGSRQPPAPGSTGQRDSGAGSASTPSTPADGAPERSRGGDVTTPASSDSVRTHVATITAGISDANVRVVSSMDEIPASHQREAMRRSGVKNEQWRGVVVKEDDGRFAIYLNASALTSLEETERTLWHEATHRGFRNVLGAQAYGQLLERLFVQMGGRPAFAEQIRDYYGDEFDIHNPLHRQTVVDEWLARTSERVNEPGFAATWRRLVNAIKAYVDRILRERGWLTEVSTAEIEDVLRRMARAGLREASETQEVEPHVRGLARWAGEQNAAADVGSQPAFSLRAGETIEREFADENARLREEHDTAWTKAKRAFRRNFAPGGLLPGSVFEEKIERDNELQAIEFDVRHLVGDLERAIKADFGVHASDMSAEQTRELNEALAGRASESIPLQSLSAILAMRQYIDALSTDYAGLLAAKLEEKLAADPAADVERDTALHETILGNLGQYVHRSYRAFDDPKWFAKVPDDVLNAARGYLANGYREQGHDAAEAHRLAEVSLHEILKTGTAYDSMEAFIVEGKLGAKDLSVLMRRQSIAPEIRALLGEYHDPAINFAKTASKMGRLIWNQRFLDRVREMGMGTFLFEGKDRPPEATKQIAGEASDAYAPLNGLWTTPEIERAFRDALGKERMGDLYRAVVRFNGVVKYGKTVLSPTTAARNFQSAMFFALANGHFDLTQMRKSIAGLREQVLRNASEENLAYLRKLKTLGVVYDTPFAGEMIRLLEDARLEELLDRGGAPLRVLRKANQIAKGFYSFGDDFWKIVGFENEKASLMRAGLDEIEAEVEAAERIRNTYPTYSMVGRAVKALARFPLVGTFVSFPAEIIRTSANIVRYIHQDLTSDNPRLRALGAKRLVGMTLVAGGFAAAAALSRAMLGVDDDEDEAVRELAPPWQKNSTLFYTGRDKDGRLHYFDLSFLDPYGYLKRPLTAMLRDQPWEDAAASALHDLLEPFLGADISAEALYRVVANRKATGGPIYNEHAEPTEQAVAIADYLRQALQPGFVGNAERLVKASLGLRREGSGQPFEVSDELLALVGWRASTVDPKVAVYYRAFEFADALADARKTLTSELRNVNPVSDGDIRSAYRAAQDQSDDAFTQMSRLIGAAVKAGMTRREVVEILRSNRVSAGNVMALNAGVAPAVDLSEESLRSAILNARNLDTGLTPQEMRRRYRIAKEEERRARAERRRASSLSSRAAAGSR